MKRALIVVDYQNDFVDGALGFSKAKCLEDAICEKIKAYRNEKQDILFTFDTHSKDYLNTQEGKKLPVEHCIKGTQGWLLYGKTASLIQEKDKIFEKGGFGSFELAEYVEEKGYDEIELIGVVSNICVISNAILVKAALPEARIFVDASCTASNDDTMNEKALDILVGLQVDVTNR